MWGRAFSALLLFLVNPSRLPFSGSSSESVEPARGEGPSCVRMPPVHVALAARYRGESEGPQSKSREEKIFLTGDPRRVRGPGMLAGCAAAPDAKEERDGVHRGRDWTRTESACGVDDGPSRLTLTAGRTLLSRALGWFPGSPASQFPRLRKGMPGVFVPWRKTHLLPRAVVCVKLGEFTEKLSRRPSEGLC